MPENRTSGYDRRRFLRDAAAGTAAVSAGGARRRRAGPAARPAPPPRAAATGTRRAGAVSFRWWGTSGWRIDIGDRTVLVDPYLSRFDTGLFSGAFNPETPLTVRHRRHRRRTWTGRRTCWSRTPTGTTSTTCRTSPTGPAPGSSAR